jgi:hypothetical protein
VCCFIQITARLCEEILGGVADGTLELQESEGVLGDALHILASKEIKLSAVRSGVSCASVHFQYNRACDYDPTVDTKHQKIIK